MGRIGDAVTAIEQGQSVDWRRMALLQQLDVAAAGERFLAESLAAEREADEHFRQQLERIAG